MQNAEVSRTSVRRRALTSQASRVSLHGQMILLACRPSEPNEIESVSLERGSNRIDYNLKLDHAGRPWTTDRTCLPSSRDGEITVFRWGITLLARLSIGASGDTMR